MSKKTNWTPDQWATIHTAILRYTQYRDLNGIKPKDIIAKSNGLFCDATIHNRLVKTYKNNKMNRDVLEAFAEIMGISPNDLCPNYQSFLPKYSPRPNKRKRNELDIFYNVEETIEETTTIAELEDSIEFIVEDLEHYIERLQDVLYRLKNLKIKETANDK